MPSTFYDLGKSLERDEVVPDIRFENAKRGASRAWGYGFRSTEGRLLTWRRLLDWFTSADDGDVEWPGIIGGMIGRIENRQPPTYRQQKKAAEILELAVRRGFRREE